MIDQLENIFAETRELFDQLRQSIDNAETEFMLLKNKLKEHGVIVK